MSLKDLLAELQKEYLATFGDKVAAIDLLWREKKLEELESEFHKLKGTGRTYGLPEVSQLGEAMERLCESLREASAATPKADSETQLQIAVPLSIRILERIRTERSGGTPLNLESDRDFRAIVDLVMRHDQE